MSSDPGNVLARIAAASAGRDRVLDAVKAAALVVVVAGHSLAWHITDDNTPVNVLEQAPGLIVLTWVFQVLPLFFAAGAVANLASLERHGPAAFRLHRTRGLATPVVLYAGVWTAVMMLVLGVARACGADGAVIGGAGRFLSQLLWFAGVYLVVVAAVPLTARWRGRPLLALGLWLAAVVAVDLVRVSGGPSWLGWANFLLVWGWLHQLGYYLPQLRAVSRWVTAGVAVVLLGAAVGLALTGPYSSSLVTVAGDEGLSNLAPPSVVLLLYGAAQICALAALWPALARALSDDRLWAVVALVGARGMGIYLWHIPLVGCAAAIAMAVAWHAAPLSAGWWVVHVAVVAVVLPLAWLIAGAVGGPERRLRALPTVLRLTPAIVAFGTGAAIISIAVTGFATLWGAGLFGLSASALLNLGLLVLFWQASAQRAPGGRGSGGGTGAGGT